MRKLFAIISTVFTFAGTAFAIPCAHVFGKIQVVESGEDYKVCPTIMQLANLRVTVVTDSAMDIGQWQFVGEGESCHYKIRFVETGADFTVYFTNVDLKDVPGIPAKFLPQERRYVIPSPPPRPVQPPPPPPRHEPRPQPRPNPGTHPHPAPNPAPQPNPQPSRPIQPPPSQPVVKPPPSQPSSPVQPSQPSQPPRTQPTTPTKKEPLRGPGKTSKKNPSKRFH